MVCADQRPDMAQLVDTHTHVNFQPFLSDYLDVIKRATDLDIVITNVGTQWESSQRSVGIAEELGGLVYAAVGLHPLHLFKDIVEEQSFGGKTQKIVAKAEQFDPSRYHALAQSSHRVVAIGECGLDYYHTDGLATTQQAVLRQHIELAQALDLPLIIHCREAYEDLIILLTEFKNKIRGTIHCYTGESKYIPEFLNLGFYIGFTGIVTFKNAENVRRSALAVPLERLLLETDAPYLAPEPYRGQQNEPSYVRFVADALAKLHGVSYDELARQTTKNAFELFQYS